MAELKCNDGTIVQISAKTEAELRKAFGPKHIWKHGDVFENINGRQIYLKPFGGHITCILDKPNLSGTPEVQLDGSTFLFNIKDKL